MAARSRNLDTLSTCAEALEHLFKTLESSDWMRTELEHDEIDEYGSRIASHTSTHTKRSPSSETYVCADHIVNEAYAVSFARRSGIDSYAFIARWETELIP